MFFRLQIRLFPLIVLAFLTAEYSRGIFCQITSEEVEQLFKESANVESERTEEEVKLAKEGKVINSSRKVADICLLRQRDTDPKNRLKELKQLPFEVVTIKLIQKHNLTLFDVNEVLPKLQLKGPYCTKAQEDCLQNLFDGECDSNSRYRTADGTCNNLLNTTWGSAGSCFNRMLPAYYVGESGFRQSVAGGPLPEPRDISLNVHSGMNRPTNYVNHMYMFFGQLLDHDLTQAPISVTVDNEPIECCNVTGQLHPQCAPISLRPEDPFYSQFGTQCMNFVRSAICSTCTLGTRQQINQITAFVDASFVYGNNLNETSILRTNDGTGRMRVQTTPVGDLLPPSPDPLNDQCSFVNTSDICFLAGDARANQHTTLASLQTIFLREHNRLADGLRQINPFWNEERIFQEARRIVGAEMQVITYKEYLPITLGRDRMDYFRLWVADSGTSSYDPLVDPSLYTEFSTAGFRFGHSLINSVVALTPRTSSNQLRTLRNEFFQPFDLLTGIISPLMSGVTGSPAQFFDRHVVPDVSNFLYRIRGQLAGLDLASINIQRGRDNGIPPYIEMVRFCSEGNIIVNRFQDLARLQLMTQENGRLLQENYITVGDIDLWTGILLEIPNEGAVVGPTAACIIGIQFFNLKFGDRFYFEHRSQAGSFTSRQIQELRRMTLSAAICLNTDVQHLPLNAMLFNSRNNPNIQCPNIKGVNLYYWKE